RPLRGRLIRVTELACEGLECVSIADVLERLDQAQAVVIAAFEPPDERGLGGPAPLLLDGLLRDILDAVVPEAVEAKLEVAGIAELARRRNGRLSVRTGRRREGLSSQGIPRAELLQLVERLATAGAELVDKALDARIVHQCGPSQTGGLMKPIGFERLPL